MRRSDVRAKLTVVVVAAAIFVPLVVAVALFTDAFANAFSATAILQGLLTGAGVVAGFGIVNLLTLSLKWRKPVAGGIILAFGLLLASLLWLIWTFSNSPSIPEWMIRAARNLPRYTPQSRIDYGMQAISSLALGVFAAALHRFFQKPWQRDSKKREAKIALLMIGVSLTIILTVYVLSGT